MSEKSEAMFKTNHGVGSGDHFFQDIILKFENKFVSLPRQWSTDNY